MANLTETVTYETGIYQLELTDPVDAGVGGAGISNLQAKQLANRTAYLKQETDNHTNDITNINTNITTLFNTGILQFGGRKHKNTTVISTNTTLDEATHSGTLLWVTGGTITPQSAGAGTIDGVTYTIFNASGALLPISNVYIGTFSSNQTIYLEEGDCVELVQYKVNAGVLRTLVVSWYKRNSVPVGTIQAFAGTSIPYGWLKCNGAALAQADYPALYSVLGTTFNYLGSPGSGNFRMPDLRGEFIRGFDDGRGIDSGRVFGLSQGETLILGSLGVVSSQLAVSADNPDSTSIYSTTGQASTSTGSSVNHTKYGVRPRNVALHYLIKY